MTSNEPYATKLFEPVDLVSLTTWQVLYANMHDIPFLVVGGAHGAIDSLGSMKNGIQIWTRNLNHVVVADDGQTAAIGGGALSKEVVDGLWAANKQTSKPPTILHHS